MAETDIVELVKARNRIEEVIEADGFQLASKLGRYRKGSKSGHDSLVVDVNNQAYHWNSCDEHGDVIAWVMARQKTDFKAACELLARRAGLPPIEWSGESQVARAAARAREDAMGAAVGVFVRWLWDSPGEGGGALEYARGRGFSDDLLRTSMCGYSGPLGKRAALGEELRRTLTTQGVDGFGPAAVALCGYSGDVAQWGMEHNIQVRPDWVEQGYIPGLVGKDMLLYAHVKSGRVCYYSGRGVHEKIHYNLPAELVGPRQPYFNSAWAPSEELVVVVEGQADALSLAQWGVPGVALSGVSLDEDLALLLAGHQTRYMGLDADKAGDLVTYLNKILKGNKASGTLKGALALGPTTRLLHWACAATNSDEQAYVKDANDLLKLWSFPMVDSPAGAQSAGQAPKPAEDQLREVERLINGSLILAEEVAQWAGKQEGAKRTAAINQAMEIIAAMDRVDLAHYRTALTKALGLPVRDFEHLLKTILASKDSKDDIGGEPVFTWGGCMDGWLLEYLYDIKTGQASLAWRDPEGAIGSGPDVRIEGRRYLPAQPNAILETGGVIFPSGLGEKRTIRELVAYIVGYLKSVYLLPSERTGRLIAYWILSSWVYDCFETVIYLRAMGGPGSGKSELMKRIGMICYRTMSSNGAASTSSLFRSLERYKGTVFIDEADLQESDAEQDMVKFYNLGAMRNNPIWRTVESTGPDGEKTWEAVAFQTFCPKLVAMRKEFRDDAVGSRSLTLKLVSREMIELKAAGVPLVVNNQFRERAQALRNMLCRWRLETWQEEIEVDAEFYDMTISPRLNQVAGPLLAIARDDLDQQNEIRETLRDYYAESIITQSMTLGARVLEALWKIWQYPDLHKQMVRLDTDGSPLIKIGDITKIANQMIDEMNDEEGDDEDKKKRREVKAQRIGKTIREEFQMQVSERRRDGFFVYWNETRMQALSNKYGINPEDFGPKKGEENSLAGNGMKPTPQGGTEAAKATQESLV